MLNLSIRRDWCRCRYAQVGGAVLVAQVPGVFAVSPLRARDVVEDEDLCDFPQKRWRLRGPGGTTELRPFPSGPTDTTHVS